MHWHQLVLVIVVPFVVGAAGTLWSRDPIVGQRVARLAAITAGLGLFLYGTLAVAVIGAGGPFDRTPAGPSGTPSATGSATTWSSCCCSSLVIATVGWGGAAAAGPLLRRTPTPTVPGPISPNSETQQEA